VHVPASLEKRRQRRSCSAYMEKQADLSLFFAPLRCKDSSAHPDLLFRPTASSLAILTRQSLNCHSNETPIPPPASAFFVSPSEMCRNADAD